jgi:hypothetical protein
MTKIKLRPALQASQAAPNGGPGSPRSGHLLVGVQHAGGINEGGTGLNGGRDAERFSDLFLRGAVTRRRFGVHGDTAVTPDGNGNRERDQFTGLRPSRLVFWPAAVSA